MNSEDRSDNDEIKLMLSNQISEKFTLENLIFNYQKNKAINDILDFLDYRERRIIEMRYGLKNKDPKHYEEIGKEFDITRERVRQIETIAMMKIIHKSKNGHLREFLSEINE